MPYTATRAGDAHGSDERTVPVVTASDATRGSASHMDPAKADWSAERLPPELLGAAFVYLPLLDAVAASHVSRYWREVALATPQLWATIRKTCRTASDMEFVTTLLSRSGSIADVSVICYYRPNDCLGDLLSPPNDNEHDFDILIRPYLHKIRSLTWYSWDYALSLCDAAPFMERLRTRGPVNLQPDLLGGGSGLLRAFRCNIAHFSAACPALASVVELRIDDLQLDTAAACPWLFDLCPRLETLHVGGLRNETSHLLLSGPPPVPLRAVTLVTVDPECNLMQHFVDLRTPRVRTFALKFKESGRLSLGSLPEPFLRGATALSIREPFMVKGSWFVATLPDKHEHSLALPEICVPELAQRIVACRTTCLQSIRRLDITIDLLEHFVAVVAVLPALEHITIHLETFEGSLAGPPRHPDTELVGWDALEYVQPVLDAAPQLLSLVVDALVSWNAPGAMINVRDAEFILSYLEFLNGRPASVPDIIVLGFDAEIVRGLDLDGLPVRFVTAMVDETSYWPFHIAYNDH